MMQPCGKLYGDSSKILNTESPYDSTMLPLGIGYPKEAKAET